MPRGFRERLFPLPNPLPTPFLHPKPRSISAVGRHRQAGSNGLIQNSFLMLMRQFLGAKTHFSAADSGIATASNRRGRGDEASGSGLPGTDSRPVSELAWRASGSAQRRRRRVGRRRCYGLNAGPRGSGTVADFSCQSFDHGVSGRGTETPSTRMSSTCSLKKQR